MNGLFISKKKYHCLALWASLLACLHGCKIENDIPYPTVTGDILSFEVEGQCASPDNGNTAATINTTERTVTLYVDDTVDLTQLRIRRFTVSNEATILADEAACTDFARFPTQGFETPDNLADTRVDFTQPVRFTLQTYQDYVWTVSVTQIVERTIDIVGQVRAVVDVENRTAIIYVAEGQDLHNLQVNRMDLGGASGKVVPDPTALHDFSSPLTFQVTQGWEEVAYEWTVFVYNDSGDTSASTEAAPMSTGARVSGTIESGKTPVVEYRQAGTEAWTELPASAVTVSGTQFTAQLTGLAPATTYEYRIVIDGTPEAQQSFTTAPATPLTNGGFEDWSSEPAANGTLWRPWPEGGESFWDTGNRGATTIGDSNSVPTNDTSNGSGRAAMLQSKWSVLSRREYLHRQLCTHGRHQRHPELRQALHGLPHRPALPLQIHQLHHQPHWRRRPGAPARRARLVPRLHSPFRPERALRNTHAPLGAATVRQERPEHHCLRRIYHRTEHRQLPTNRPAADLPLLRPRAPTTDHRSFRQQVWRLLHRGRQQHAVAGRDGTDI